jgi:hypothetical protein
MKKKILGHLLENAISLLDLIISDTKDAGLKGALEASRQMLADLFLDKNKG